MSQPNILVSNGTCYSAAGKKLDGSFIPCGNDAFGHVTCCGAGDNCLADLSCFGVHGSGYGSLLTYQAGCTDPDYKDGSCPNKHIDQPWIALTLCDHSNGAWAVCSQIGDPTTLQNGAHCTCTDVASATVAFSDTNTLTSLCSLPKSVGQSIDFFAGHTPTAATTAASGSSTAAAPPPASSGAGPTTGSSAPATTTTNAASNSAVTTAGSTGSSSSGSSPTGLGQTGSGTSAAASNTPAASQAAPGAAPASSPGLSTGAKIGIGVGVAVGALLLLAVVAAILFLRRRRRLGHDQYDPDGGVVEAGDKKPDQRASALSSTATAPTVPEADSRPVSEADSKPAPPWAMGRSELNGRPISAGPQSAPIAGVGASAVAADKVGGAAATHHENITRNTGELSPIAELPGRRTTESGDPKPQGPAGAGLAVVGPEGAHFPGEEEGARVSHPWGWQWRDGHDGNER